MKICKYCKKLISNDAVWNPDSEGNGYHYTCLCNERDIRIYNKGKADVLGKLKAEIEEKYGDYDICEWFEDYDYEENDISEYRLVGNVSDILAIIDKYREESEVDEK